MVVPAYVNSFMIKFLSIGRPLGDRGVVLYTSNLRLKIFCDNARCVVVNPESAHLLLLLLLLLLLVLLLL